MSLTSKVNLFFWGAFVVLGVITFLVRKLGIGGCILQIFLALTGLALISALGTIPNAAFAH